VEEALPRQVDGVEIVLQLRALPDRWALMVLGAAYRDDLPTMRRIVSGALAAVEGRLDAEATARATARVRRDLLYRARTPLGLVSAVGRAMEPAGDPGAAARYLAALDQVDQATVRAFLAELRADGGASAEVRP